MPGRPLLLLAAVFLAAFAPARGSDAIPHEPTTGRSATVSQPHVTAELIAESTTLRPGDPLNVVLHLHMDPDWHTYWINPGDAGLATAIKWTLPMGLRGAGAIEWPTPEVHMMGPLTTYGYGGDVYLPVSLGPLLDLKENLPQQETLKARALWLVCREECIPGKADLSLDFTVAGPGHSVVIDPARKAFFDAVRARLPVPNSRWKVGAAYQIVALNNGRPNALVIDFQEQSNGGSLGHPQFFVEQPNVLATKNTITSPAPVSGSKTFDLVYSLQQNGEQPAELSGVLVSDQPLIGKAQAVQVGPFSTHADVPPISSASIQPASENRPASSSIRSPTSLGVAGSEHPAITAPPAPAATPFLPAILLAAFAGGVILNLMPCVLPVLSLKVFSLIRHAGEEKGGAWKQGVAFAAGVVVSFWILASILIAFESAGRHVGWGFQMQSPGFVLALIFLFFLLGLNLLGVFEVGASLVGLDVKTTSHLGGWASSFANGALATLAATPCTAPFMGTAVGFAAGQPAAISLLVFTALGLGMAAPYLALTTFPGALRLVPRPGAWMEMLRQFMGFLLLGTVIFLVYVFGALTAPEAGTELLGALLIAAVAAWIFGRASSPVNSNGVRISWTLVAFVLLIAAISEGTELAHTRPLTKTASADGPEAWSPEEVQRTLAGGRPVFVDFTAAWCLSCKVNERVALDIDSTRVLLKQKNVRFLIADWTRANPAITDTLQQFHRNGVPLYLVYSPRQPTAPQVLPEVLTPGIVQEALQKLP